MDARATMYKTTEERWVLRDPWLDVINSTSSECSAVELSGESWLVSELVRGLRRVSPCELLLLEAGS
jgi:hypothetical protein